MLNISKNRIDKFINKDQYKSFNKFKNTKNKNNYKYIYIILFVLFVVVLFLPWTQNIVTKGKVSTRMPDQRPQAIQSVIAGKLDKWYVKEGDFVNKGDTIVYISEIKNDYFDPNLISRTEEQVNAKSQSINTYENKVSALQKQYSNLQNALKVKQNQLTNKIYQNKNKIKIDSANLVAYITNLKIAENQYQRTNELYKEGLKSLSELQEKELKVQELQAKVISQENKLENQKNEINILYIELNAIENDYIDKMTKSESDKQSALSNKLDAISNTSKLKNQLSNYSERQKFYYITAPQSGYITKTIKKGIGEIIKEGSDIATIMPKQYNLSTEIYVKPQDIPLVQLNAAVRLRFDGWPALAISGWPKASTGVFNGRIVAIDPFISENGYYRVIISPDVHFKQWPQELRIGTGAHAFILLNNVPLWYEFWRKLNGFPAKFYKNDKNTTNYIDKKAPIKSIK